MALKQIFQITVLRDEEDNLILLHNETSYKYKKPDELFADICNFAAARFDWDHKWEDKK